MAAPPTDHREARELTLAAPPTDHREAATIHIQATLRGWFARHMLGPRRQGPVSAGGRRRTTLRVCGANTCCVRGADEAFENLEDLIPPGDMQIGRTACFAQCGLGPNVSVTRDQHVPRTRHGVDTPAATCGLLRATGVRVPRALQDASRLREESQRAAAENRHVESGTKACLAVQALTAKRMLSGSVAALRLRHKLLLMQANAAREQSRCDGAGAGAATWLACAREANEVQMRLHRAHISGPHAHLDLSTPRLVPALLLQAQAHFHLAQAAEALPEGGQRPEWAVLEAREAANCHRRQARALLGALGQPPYEPAQSRVHRVRLAEKREAERLLLRDAG